MPNGGLGGPFIWNWGGLQETTEASANLKFHQQRKKTLLGYWRKILAPYAWEMKLFAVGLQVGYNALPPIFQRLRSWLELEMWFAYAA